MTSTIPLYFPETRYPGISPKLLDLVSMAIRSRHYSRRTEDSYMRWIKRFILFNGNRHPDGMGEREVTRFPFLSRDERHVSASTQNQALQRHPLLYREVLKKDLGWLDGIVRAKKPQRLPVVLTHAEVRRDPRTRRSPADGLAPLRSRPEAAECARLRIKDVSPSRSEIGAKGRQGKEGPVTLLPARLRDRLADHIARVRLQHGRDFKGTRYGRSARRALPKISETPPGNGPGSGSSLPQGSTGTRRQASPGATICTNQSSSGRSKTRCACQESPNLPPATR